eukprot:jgi/Astpho2/7468/Aster-02045
MASGSGATEPAAEGSEGTLFGTLASWGGSALSYASSSINSLLGFGDDLEVVNPESAEAEHAKGVETAGDPRATDFASYRDYIGMDITSLVALPVWIMMPFTMLQNIAEIMEYTDPLSRAAKTQDPYERLAWVVGFTMGPFPGNERTWKPFNPILGETFELDLPERGVRFVAEQVSHHPPVGAAHGEHQDWQYDMVSAPTTKFLGNSVDIFPIGRTRIRLKSTGEVFTLVPPNCKAHNVVVGRTWVDSFGDYSLFNATTGAKAEMYFTPCGWFDSGHYEIAGHVISEDGKKKVTLKGKWNSFLDMTRCDEEGEPLAGAETVRLWECKAKPADDKYGFSHFARMLNSGKGLRPLPSDSRRRPDRTALEQGDHGLAGRHKYALEEAQRAEKREREKRDEEWAPRFFMRTPDKEVFATEYSDAECPLWEFNGKYLQLERETPAPEAGDEDACRQR